MILLKNLSSSRWVHNKKIELSELKENSDDFNKEMNTKFEILDKNIPQIDPQIIEKTNNSENIEN